MSGARIIGLQDEGSVDRLRRSLAKVHPDRFVKGLDAAAPEGFPCLVLVMESPAMAMFTVQHMPVSELIAALDWAEKSGLTGTVEEAMEHLAESIPPEVHLVPPRNVDSPPAL